MTRPRLILLIRCAVLAVALWLGAEALLLFVPVALMMPPSLLGPPPATCAIASDDFSTDRLATDYTTLAGTFAVSGGECSTSSGTARIVNNATSTTGSGKASVDAKSSNTGNTARVIGAYDGSAYAYAELTFNGSSSTWKLFNSSGTQIGITRDTFTSTGTYYTLTICWDGTYITAILSDNAGVCKGSIQGLYTSSSGNQAGFGATVAAGSVTFDNFSFGHGGGDTIGGVDCDDCSSAIDMTSGACACTSCDPPWTGDVDIDISGLTNSSCGSCASSDGVYRLVHIKPDTTNHCQWQLDTTKNCGNGTFNRMYLEVFLAGGLWQVRLTYYWSFNGTTQVQSTEWKTTSASQPDCSMFSAYDLPWYQDLYPGSPHLCLGSTATVTVTAVVI